MARSLALAAYLGVSALAEGLARRALNSRLKAGKEDPERLPERLGNASVPRPDGMLVWFHAASVGESLSLLDLIRALLETHPKLHALVTTGTTTSAELLATRLPGRAVHQFVPVDAVGPVRRFLRHWKPDLAIWTESELWPRLVYETHRTGCPMLLINARMSERSARRLRWIKGYARALFDRFDAILPVDDMNADRIYRLGGDPARITVTGNLKDSAQPLDHDADELKRLRQELAPRTIWLAASTHEGEEEMVAQAHRQARRQNHGLLTILAPRHPDRGADIARLLRAGGWRVSQRSQGEPIDRNTDFYLADTLGELGLWYRLAPVSFIGGSLVEIGGHNPFEPALLGSAIMHGPHVANFETVYRRFRRAGAAVVVPRPEDLGRCLVDTLAPDRAAALATAAWTVSSEGADVARQVRAIIDSHLARVAERAA